MQQPTLSSMPSSQILSFESKRLESKGAPMLGYPKDVKPIHNTNVADLYRHLSQVLQTSLEMEELLEMFFLSVKELIPMTALHYEHPETHSSFGWGSGDVTAAKHSVQYNLAHQAETLGAIRFKHTEPFSEHQLHQIESLMRSLFFPLRNALLYRKARFNALSDPLTGAGNRAAMDQTLNREIELARRYGHSFSVLMLDLDRFKSINDLHGHPCGDAALKAVVTQIKSQLRAVDLVFRFGGEEFLILLSNTTESATQVVGTHLCDSVAQMRFHWQDTYVPITISLGGTAYRAPESMEELLCRADKLLYQAKHNGRNQLCMAAS